MNDGCIWYLLMYGYVFFFGIPPGGIEEITLWKCRFAQKEPVNSREMYQEKPVNSLLGLWASWCATRRERWTERFDGISNILKPFDKKGVIWSYPSRVLTKHILVGSAVRWMRNVQTLFCWQNFGFLKIVPFWPQNLRPLIVGCFTTTTQTSTSKHSLCSPLLAKLYIHYDEHIFQRGWNSTTN